MILIFRQEIMFKYQNLVKENLKEVARLITLEQGKTLPDAEGDVMRGLQVSEDYTILKPRIDDVHD